MLEPSTETHLRLALAVQPSRWITIVALVALQSISAAARGGEPKRIQLWPEGAPGEPATKPADEPALFLYRPAESEANSGAALVEPVARGRTAVVVCPGGGYGHLAIEKEGSKIAQWLNSFGVTAFVLRYRHYGTGHRHPVPMLDGQRAVRTVRARADQWNVDPARIGVMGFSAGGHLASTLGTHFDQGDPEAADPIDRASCRPDFLILGYPVISLVADYTHQGSRENLLGSNPHEALARSLSNELQVTGETSPAFLFHTDADTGVPAENSVAFYLALRRAGVPGELHVYAAGPHGVGLAEAIPGTNTWPDRCREWMQTRGLVNQVNP